MLNG
ncbi:unnamed protein product, partial [Cuscuta europaea]|jgi:RNA polymerase sigma factor (sigma-70 family)